MSGGFHAEDARVLLPLTPPASEPERADRVWQFDKFRFRADFDSANLNDVQAVKGAASEFQLWTRSDCKGTPYETNMKSWFYFGVSGQAAGDFLILTMMSLNRQTRLYSQDYRPWVWRAGQREWEIIPNKTIYKKETDGNFQIRFSYKFDAPCPDEVFFAFAVPHSYTDTQNRW